MTAKCAFEITSKLNESDRLPLQLALHILRGFNSEAPSVQAVVPPNDQRARAATSCWMPDRTPLNK